MAEFIRICFTSELPPEGQANEITAGDRVICVANIGGAIIPDMMRWLWRDGPVSTDPNEMVERSFRQPHEAGR